MHLFKSLWVRLVRSARDEYEDTQDDIVHCNWRTKIILYVVVGYFIVVLVLGVFWSMAPASIAPERAIANYQLAHHSSQNSNESSLIKSGVATTSVLIAVSETLLDKSGGYLANDVFPPSIWLDDMPHWELGVLTEIRDTTLALNESLSQSTLHQSPDVDLQKAQVRFHFSEHSWMFPATESQYRAGIEHLKKYNARLQLPDSTDANFYADAQHLSDYLALVEKRLKNLSQRLTASVGPTVNTDASALQSTREASRESTGLATNGLYTKTPWLKIDDVFYEARGNSWAMIALLKGVEIDFAETLRQKNAAQSFDQILRELAPTQDTIYSPVILNGSGFGVVANHSLSLASYLARAQAAVADCRRQLLVP